jgi:NAD(P)-dependent dehydrogenase (short-subunit alcohol dehydrogenase family)
VAPALRLADKVAVVVGAGQTPGDTIGNGRATAILFAREGARVMVVDRDLARAPDTEAAIRAEGAAATALDADVTREADCRRLAQAALDAHGRIDVLHKNVGIGGGDAGPTSLAEEDWDRIMTANVKGLFLASDDARFITGAVLPVDGGQSARIG